MSIDPIPLLMRWMHIIAAVVAVGGAFYQRLVALPVLKSKLDDAQAGPVRDALARRWQKVVHACILLFLVSGFYNYLLVTSPQHEGQAIYHMLFGIKFLVALAVFFFAIALTSRGNWSARFRDRSGLWLGVLVALAVLTVMLGSVMRGIPPAAAS